MKKQVFPLLLVTCIIALGLQSCLNDKGIVPQAPETLCDSLDVSYNMDVKPLVQSKCAVTGCHEPNGSGPGDYNNYVVFSGMSGTVKTRIQIPFGEALHMPDGDILTQEELDILVCWIDKGTPNN